MIRLFFCIILSLLIWGCSAPPQIFVNPKYNEDTTIQSRIINVLFIPSDSIIIKNVDDVEDDFSEDKRSAAAIIQDSLFRTIKETYEKRLKGVMCKISAIFPDTMISQTDGERFDAVKKYIIGKDTLSLDFPIPKKQRLADSLIEPDIGLVISKILIGRNMREEKSFYFPPIQPSGHTVSTPGGSFNVPGAPMPTGGFSSSSLDAHVQYIFWDFKNNCEIAYGKKLITTYFNFGMTKNTWKKEFDLIAKEIIEAGPINFRKYKGAVYAW